MTLIALYLIFSMLAVIWFDATRYIIPNWLVGLLIVAYAYAAFTAPTPVDWQMAIAGMAVTLVCGYVIFSFRFMGAGDIKLMAALALWTGTENLADFVFITTLFGGVLSLALWGIRKLFPRLPKPPKTLPRILQEGAPVPYGIAIALAFIILVWSGKIPVLG